MNNPNTWNWRIIRQNGGRTLAGLTALAVVFGAYKVNDWSEHRTSDIGCIAGSGKAVDEGMLDKWHKNRDFAVTTADGKSVARIVIAASEYDGILPLSGLQALSSKPVPTQQLFEQPSVVLPDAETVILNPADTTNFSFVAGLGQAATLRIDSSNTVQIIATTDQATQYPDSVKLAAQCVVK